MNGGDRGMSMQALVLLTQRLTVHEETAWMPCRLSVK